MHTLKSGFFAVLCAALLAAPAHAEKADRDKPVNLEADTVTLDDIRKVSVYQGNVILRQGTLMLRADRVQVTQTEDGLDKVVATGRPVAFRQKVDGRDEFIEGFANRIEYDSVKSQLELIGQAQLRRGSDELRGAQISYNANTEFYKVVGQPDAKTPSGRVRAVIRPKPRTQQPAAQP
ncbi:MAG: lipopolysaccharide transport periplasmic protein LptA [Gammaproteobacteria bacterium]|nr:lipopolysaccharide transport periplasmic protein LptA [Gammaproteobacteria bacterium]MBU1407520.1 lipopolysaccharide transport periplasmic protein LptA [Gammaproteobacteria bacterium]MBU1531633.1 lipopolysaccharide transport periplasmic protein LptA [Gammaproteobacteria bacterium]